MRPSSQPPGPTAWRRDRLPIILMAHRGRPHQEIATDLALSTRSVQRRLNAYLGRGIDGLRCCKAQATPRLAPHPQWTPSSVPTRPDRSK